MSKKLILTGYVQGVMCRHYCSKYGKLYNIHGSASNLADGSVKVILDTDDPELISQYIHSIKTNSHGFVFYGSIDDVEVREEKGPVHGDYNF